MKANLSLFMKRSQQLMISRLPQTGMPLELTFTFPEGVTVAKSTELDQDDLNSVVAIFRPFTLSQEPIFLNKIFNSIHISGAPNEVKDRAAKLRADYARTMNHFSTTIEHEGVPYTSQETFEIILNGQYAHLDPDKAKIYDTMDPVTREMARHQFLNVLRTGIDVVLLLRPIVAQVLEGPHS